MPAEDQNVDGSVDVIDCAGPGIIMESASALSGPVFSGCTNFGNISITVPSAGTIVLTSTVVLIIDHTAGTQDRWRIVHEDTPTDCENIPYNQIGEISAAVGNDGTIFMTPTVFTVDTVAAGGTYTYHLNGLMITGESAGDNVSSYNIVAVFYPS
jgi:hypothetical protein